MAALGSEVLGILGRDIFWISFFQFLLFRPILQVLPRVDLGNWFLNLATSAFVTMMVLAALLILPLIIFGYLPLPRGAEIRVAYFWGLIAGGLATHPFYWLLIKSRN